MMRVNSIFESISGEGGGFPQGTWCTFIRLQGCNLRCKWCDTLYAQDPSGGTQFSLEEIVRKCHTKHVLITGGEPLFQGEQVSELITQLILSEHIVQIETNGSYALPEQSITKHRNIFWVMDRKCPSSGMTASMLSPRQLEVVKVWHQWRKEVTKAPKGNLFLKYVIVNDEDLEWAAQDQMRVPNCDGVFFSPVDAEGDNIQWMAAYLKAYFPELLDRISFSVQLHKLLDLP